MVKDAMIEDEHLTLEEAIDNTCAVKCERHMVRGYSPE